MINSESGAVRAKIILEYYLVVDRMTSETSRVYNTAISIDD